MSKHPPRRSVDLSRDLFASSIPCQYSGRRSLMWRLRPRLLRAASHSRELGFLKKKEIHSNYLLIFTWHKHILIWNQNFNCTVPVCVLVFSVKHHGFCLIHLAFRLDLLLKPNLKIYPLHQNNPLERMNTQDVHFPCMLCLMQEPEFCDCLKSEHIFYCVQCACKVRIFC